MPNIDNLPEELIGARGVEMLPPPARYLQQTNTMIADAVNAIGEGRSGSFTVWIDTTTGVNAAFAQKVGSHVQIVGYAGKLWGEPLRAGVATRVEW